ncbi:MAG: TPM domain-containing protein [Filifactoraceae bacterium]
MKKIICLFLTTFILCISLSTTIFGNQKNLIIDEAGLLTQEDYSELNQLAKEVSERYQCNVNIVTVNDMGDGDAYEFAKEVYNKRGLGYGEEKSGILLLLSMSYRDYAMISHGYGNTAFTDYGREKMLDEYILPPLSNDMYYEAFKAYIEKAGEYLELSKSGKPLGRSTDPEFILNVVWVRWLITILVPLAIAGIICTIFRRKMKTAIMATNADDYILSDGFNLTGKEDRFLYITETRRKIEKSSSSSVGSDGFSGSSGKF